MTKCMVKKCENRSEDGLFEGSLCKPCARALRGDPSEASVRRIFESLHQPPRLPVEMASMIFEVRAHYDSTGAASVFYEEGASQHGIGHYGFSPELLGIHDYGVGARFEVGIAKLPSPEERPFRNPYRMVVYKAPDGTQITHYENCKALDGIYADPVEREKLVTTFGSLLPLHWACCWQGAHSEDSRRIWIGRPANG